MSVHHRYHWYAIEQFEGVLTLGKLIIGHDILQTIDFIAQNGQTAIDGDIAQIVVLHLHADGAYMADGHRPLDGLEANAADAHLGLLFATGDDKVASLIAYTTSYICGIEWVIQCDIGISNRLALTVDKPSR